MTARPPGLRLFAVVAAAGALALPAPAGAHAILTRAEPADGSRLGSGPHQVRLWFSETISSRFRSVLLVSPSGKEIAGARLRSPSGQRSLVLDLPKIRKGTYAVVWRVLAEDDGHTTGGAISFGVGKGVAPLPRARGGDSTPSVVDVVLRWLRFSLLAALFGGLAVAIAVVGPARARLGTEPARGAGRRVLRFAAIAAGLAVVAGLAALVREAVVLADTLPGATWLDVIDDLLVSSRWGHLWLAEEALLCWLGTATLALRRHSPRTPVPFVCWTAVLAAVLAVVHALGSHAAALHGSGLALGADAVHLLAAALWTGGLAALLVAITGRGGGLAVAAAVRRPFALLAGGSAVALVVTGLYSAGVQVASVDALLTTFYGRTLLLKAGLLAVAGGLGAGNFVLLRLFTRARPGRLLWGTLVAEAGAAAAALLAAGALTASSPARGAEFAPPRPVHAPTLTRQVSDLLLSVTVRPNRPGENMFTVLAASSRRPAPAPISSIRVRLPSGDAIPLREVEPGRYFGAAELGRPGAERIAVVVNRGAAAFEAPFGWSVERADPARTVWVSSRRLSSLVDPAAEVLLIGLVVAAGIGIAANARQPRRRPVRRLDTVPVLDRVREEPS